MTSSTDVSNEYSNSRSFDEYNSSGVLEADGGNECGIDPLTKSIKAIMENKLKSNGTLKSTKHVAELLNEFGQIKLPTNTNKLKSEAILRYKRDFLMFCDKCNELCNQAGWCTACELTTKKTKTNFLVYIPIEQQIKNTLESHFDTIIDYINRNKDENITDFDDGNLYQRAREKYPNSIVLCFTLNTDGAQVHNSQKKSVWPVQLYQNYLPPHLRFKSENILLVNLYFGRDKPDAKKLLYPLCKELQTLAENQISFYRSGHIFHCVPIVTCCTLDLPARKLLTGLSLYNGRSACITCLHEGITVTDHLKHKYIRYIQLNPPPPLRTHESIIRAVEKLSFNQSKKIKSVGGFTELPPMLLFDGFDLSKGFVVDYMHNGLIGIMGMLLDYWMGTHRLSKKSPFFKPMKPKYRTLLDDRLLGLKPFERITRKPKSIQDRKFYKASEYRNLLLYYLPICLEGLLDEKLLKHFKLLSAAVYILLKTSIPVEEINEAHTMLITFANEFEILYGSEAVTMNIHLLRHYKESVLNSGPLWSTSMFGFESNIGVLCKPAKNSPTDELDIISFNYCLWRSEKPCINAVTTMIGGKWSEMPEEIATILQQNQIKPSEGKKFFVGNAIKIKTQHLKSIKSKETKSIDHFIEMKDSTIGCVYVYVKFENDIYLVLNEYDVIETSHHLKKIKPLHNLKIYSLKDVSCKLLYMKFSNTESVAKEPNHFEN